jgi:hypothetical protein
MNQHLARVRKSFRSPGTPIAVVENTKRGQKETEMGWIISVGRAGAKRASGVQAVSLRMDVQGMPVQVKVFPDGGCHPASSADALDARQAQRVWQNVLSSLVGH